MTRKLGTMAFGLYAHRSYPHLARPENWQFIAWDQSYSDMSQQSWLLGIAGERQVACELTHSSEHLVAVRAKVGVAGLPCLLGDKDPDLVRIHENVPYYARDVWLVVHRDLRKNPAIRAVMDFVSQVIAKEPLLRISR